MRILFLFLVLLSGCTLSLSSNLPESRTRQELETKVAAHDQLLSAMVSYFNQLQEKGILPKPDDVTKKENPK